VLLKWNNEDNLSRPKDEQLPWYKRCSWFAIYPLYVCGGLLDTASFAFAPMSLLAPTSSFTIVINTVFARFVLGEKMTSAAVVGTCIIVIGAVVCTIFGSKESEQRSVDELKALFQRAGYIHYQYINCSIWLVCILLSIVVIPWYYKDIDDLLEQERNEAKIAKEAAEGVPGPGPVIHVSDGNEAVTEASDSVTGDAIGAAYSVDNEMKSGLEDSSKQKDEKSAAEEAEEAKQRTEEINRLTMETYQRRREKSWIVYGIWAVSYSYITCAFGVLTNTMMKCNVEMVSLSLTGENQLTEATFYLFIGAILLSAIFQLTSCVYMMCAFPAIFIVPIYQCMFIVSLIVGGSTYFEEFEQMKTLDICLFLLGCLICFCGIAFMTVIDFGDGENAGNETETVKDTSDETNATSRLESSHSPPKFDGTLEAEEQDGYENRGACLGCTC